jgi:hypothetical protein
MIFRIGIIGKSESIPRECEMQGGSRRKTSKREKRDQKLSLFNFVHIPRALALRCEMV